MLPSLGYFRSIVCPAVTKDGACYRPYCQFRHSNIPSSSTDNAISLDAVNQAIQDLKSKIHNTSNINDTETVVSEEVSYVPYKPYEPASNLYKDFRQAGSSKTSIDHYEIQQRSRKKSILHAAKGPQNRSFKKQFQQKKNKPSSTVKYTLNAVTKPVTDLEYDPLCNYNVAVSSELEPMENSADSHEEEISLIKDKETLSFDDDELPDTDLVIDDVDEKQQEEENDTKLESDSENLHPPCKLSPIIEDKSFKIKHCSVRLDVSKQINELAEKSPPDFHKINKTDTSKFRNSLDSNLQENLFGNDSDCEIIAVFNTKSSKKKSFSGTSDKTPKQITTSKEELTKNEKQVVLKKCERDTSGQKKDKNSTQHSKFNKKLKKGKKADKHLPKNDSISPIKQNISGKISKRKHNEDGSSKPKKKKINPQKDANISDYIAEDEIKRLDKELQGENMLEECMQIYKEGLSEKASNAPKSVDQPKVLQESKGKPIESKITDPSKTNIPRFKAIRKAHTSADNSATSLCRVPKKARRFPTPAQAMLRRLEIIKHEQEEKILDAAIAGYSMLPSARKSRLAHPSSKNVSSANLEEKTCKTEQNSYVSLLLTSRHQRKPFVDLVRSKTDSTQQGTVTKGCKRVAHEQKKEVSPGKEVIERPKILPDRFSKVPTNIRQRYLSVFIDECLRIFAKDRRKAYQMAKMEEKQCKERSNTKNIYLSLAASTLKKLRNMDSTSKQAVNRIEKVAPDESSYYPTPVKVAFKSNGARLAHGSSTSKTVTDRLKNNVKHPKVSKTPRRQNSGFSVLPKESSSEICGEEVYEKMCKYIMTEEQLQENGYPRPGDVPGNCVFMVEKGKLNNDPTKKICARCGKEFVLYKSGNFAKQDDECIHHWGRAYFTKVGSTWEKRYNCCQNPVGSEGCSVGETHVHQDNKLSVSGYVRTLDKTSDSGNPGIFSLDCEMVYSTVGLELVRVSVVDYDFNVVYDTFVKPRGKILDYNTRWSGVCEKNMVGVKTTIRDVQAAFLTKFSSDTILMGHSLESDLVALRIIHSTVVDTSIVFPHRLGPPYKRALRNLMSDFLGILIQNADDEGHDSSEDATACIKLMKWKLAEDAKLGH